MNIIIKSVTKSVNNIQPKEERVALCEFCQNCTWGEGLLELHVGGQTPLVPPTTTSHPTTRSFAKFHKIFSDLKSKPQYCRLCFEVLQANNTPRKKGMISNQKSQNPNHRIRSSSKILIGENSSKKRCLEMSYIFRKVEHKLSDFDSAKRHG